MRILDEYMTLKQTELGLLPTNWQVEKLEDLTTHIIDCLHEKKPDFIDNGDKIYLEVFNIGQDGFLDLSKVNYITNEVFSNWVKRLRPQHKDIVISKTGRVGAVAFLPEGYNFCIGRNQVIIRSESSKLLPEYLLLYLMSSNFQHELKRLTTDGTVLQSLHVKYISQIKVPLPPLKEQRIIVNIAYSLMLKMKTNESMNSLLESLSHSLFHSWFVRFDPFQDDEFVDSEVGPLPKGWEVKQLSEIADYVNGKAFTVLATPTGRPIIKIAELKNGISNRTKNYDDDVGSEHIAYFDDILFAWSASLGIYRWFGETGVINQHIFKVIPINLPKWFVYYEILLAMPWFLTIAESKTTTMGHIKRSHLDEYKIAVPPEEILKLANKQIMLIYNKIAVNSQEILLLSSLHDLLLPQLLSGKLRIKKPEKFLEEINNEN